jgi:small neutral amino acid transporter SnatA (MarC family)
VARKAAREGVPDVDEIEEDAKAEEEEAATLEPLALPITMSPGCVSIIACTSLHFRYANQNKLALLRERVTCWCATSKQAGLTES